MSKVINIFVSSNGRVGYCRKCGNREVALADVAFPNGKNVEDISCPDCIIADSLLQARLMVSIGFAHWPGFDVTVKYEFVRI